MGVSNDTDTNADLAAIYQGGENFLARMKALTDQRSAIEKMLAELNLGRDAKAAYDDALKKQEEAASLLDQAKAEAQKILDRAQSAASDVKTEANDYAATVRASVADHERVASTARAEAERLRNDAADIQKNLSQYKADAESAKSAAKAAEGRALAIIALFKTAIEQAGAI